MYYPFIFKNGAKVHYFHHLTKQNAQKRLLCAQIILFVQRKQYFLPILSLPFLTAV
jgi:hypothetical protein